MTSLVKPVGIDVGTWKICAASLDANGHSEMIRDEAGDIFLPNTVRFTEAAIVVGKEARKAMFLRDEAAYWMKRELGTALYSRPIRGQKLPPEVIQACVLRRLRETLYWHIPGEWQCFLSVPSHFDQARRQALLDAAEIAGFTPFGLVEDHVAAVLAFLEAAGETLYQDDGQERRFFVFDLGGGACQMAFVVFHNGLCRTLSYHVDPQLSSYDFDLRLGELIVDHMLAQGLSDPRNDPVQWSRVYPAIVEAKHNLSARDRTHFEVDVDSSHFEMVLNREEFKQRCEDLLMRLRRKIARQLAQWDQTTLNSVTLIPIGGGVRMPRVQRLLVELFGRAPRFSVNPDEAIARGVTLFAALRMGIPCSLHHPHPAFHANKAQPELDVQGVLSYSLFLQLSSDPHGDEILLVQEGTPLPFRVVHSIDISSQESDTTAFNVWKEVASHREIVGTLGIKPIPPAPRPFRVEIELTCEKSGTLMWTAHSSAGKEPLMAEFIAVSGMERHVVAQWRETLYEAKTWAHVSHGLSQKQDSQVREIPDSPQAVTPPSTEPGASPGAEPASRDQEVTGTPAARPRHPRLAVAQAQGRWKPLEIASPKVPDAKPPLSPSELRATPPPVERLSRPEIPRSPPLALPPPIPKPLVPRNAPRVTREELLRVESSPISLVTGGLAVQQPVPLQSPSPEFHGSQVPLLEPGPLTAASHPWEATPASRERTKTRRRFAERQVHIGFGIKLPRSVIGLVGFILSGLVGLAIGYWLIAKLFPESWLLRVW